MKLPSYNFLFITASTGGHVFPLLSLAIELRTRGHKIHFITSGSSLEKNILNRFRFPYSVLSVGRLNKGVSFSEKLKTCLYMPFYLMLSVFLIFKHKPNIVLSTGGAVSGPLLLVSSFLKKSIIWELNSVPGLTNKILSYFVQKIFIHFKSTQSIFPKEKTVYFPFIIRKKIVENLKKREADGYSHLLILGGSQGAHNINKAILEMYSQEEMKTWKIKHQTGEKDFQSIHSIYSANSHFECASFYENIEECYHWADIIVCRAGAGTLAELSACEKAAIVIPLPSSSNNHQLKNALVMYKKEAIELIQESDLNGKKLFETIMKVQSEKKYKLEQNIKKFYNANSLEDMMNYLINYIQ